MVSKKERGIDRQRLIDILEHLDTADEKDVKTDKRVLIKLIKLIYERGMLLEDFARIFNYTKPMWGLYLRGKRALSVTALLKIADALEVDASTLLPGESKLNIPFDDYIKQVIKEIVEEKCLKK